MGRAASKRSGSAEFRPAVIMPPRNVPQAMVV